MKKGICKLFLALIVILLSFTMVSAANDIPARDNENDWVVDQANVLDEQTEDIVQFLSQKLADEFDGCIAVLTVDYYSGTDFNAYATNVFNSWKLGDADKENGILLVLAIGDDDYYMLEGRGLEEALSVDIMDDLLYYNLEPDFAAKDYSAGVTKVVQATYDWLYDYYEGNYSPDVDRVENDAFETILGAIFALIIIAMLVFTIAAILDEKADERYYKKYGVRRRPSTSYYSGSSYRSSGYSSSSHSSSSYSSHHSSSSHSYSSSSSRSSGSGRSYGGSSRGSGAGRRH